MTMKSLLKCLWLLLLVGLSRGFVPSTLGTPKPMIQARLSKVTLTSLQLPYLSQRQSQPSLAVEPSLIRNLMGKIDEVAKWRAVIFTFFSTLLLNRHAIDAKLVDLWRYLLTSSALPARIFRTDSYEWCLAVVAITSFIHMFGYADRVVRRASERGQIHPWRKYRLQDRYLADRHRRSGKKDKEMLPVQHSPWHWQAWSFELWVYVLPLLVWDLLAPRRHRRIGGFGPPTTLGILGGITGGLLLYDFLFFFGHLAMHKVPFLYKHLHKKHHTSEEVRACDQVRLTLGEEVIDVGFSIIALNALGVHPVARSIYNCVIIFLLVELHCGFDFPWTPQNVVPFGLATGSRRHHFHHRFGQHYYQKFFFTLDRLCGFFQKDDGSLKGHSIRRDTYVPPDWKTA